MDDGDGDAQMRKAGDTGDIIPANFLDVIGFSAKFKDFIGIFRQIQGSYKDF